MRVTSWFEALYECETKGRPYAIATVLTTAGSTPREGGSKMIITDDGQYDTIGGGHLEHKVSKLARTLLAKGQTTQTIESYPLSSSLGQCCGGAMKVLIEVKVDHCQNIAIFGAGHVAHALVPILAQLPLQISWFDNRENMFANRDFGSNVLCNVEQALTGEAALLPSNTWVVIMTHDHQLDFDLVNSCLKRNDLPFIGLIGSQTKAKRFFTRLQHRGFDKKQLNRLVSPIGDSSVNGKRPIEVAVSISAQIINKLNSATEKLTPSVENEEIHKV